MHLTRRAFATVASGLGRSSVRAAVLAALLVALTVLPAVAAGNGPTALVDPAVSPTSGTPATRITLSVTYKNAEGSAPDYVRVVIGTTTREMHKTSSGDHWKRGARYSVTTTLPVGTWKVLFRAMDRERFIDAIAGPSITIKPAATAEPTPKPTPKPTARPTAAPTATPTAIPGEDATATPAPAAPTFDSSPGTSPAQAGASPDPVTAGLLPGAGGPMGGEGGGAGPGGTGGSGDGSLPGGLGGPPSVLTTIVRVLPTVVVTTGGVTMLMAFLAFGKRRRDETPPAPDAVLGANAARGLGVPAHSGFVPGGPPAAVAAAPAAVQAIVGVATVGDVDAHLPRWRRPSLMEARKADPLRNGSTGVRLTFDGEVGNAIDGMERRLIRYRLVSLLDAPDEVRGMEIGVLDEGDEVVLLEKRGTYWRILSPDGREGWLHKMTLGDVVIDSSAAGTASWTSGDDGPALGGFEDVIRAYTERRQQFGDA